VNNPLIYTDPSGEIAWWVVPAVVGGIIGGVSNLVANWDNVDGFWDGVSTFGTGALAGAGTAVTGGSGAGIFAVAGVSAGGGALVAANNDIVAQTGKNFNGFNSVDWTHVGKSSFTGGVSGYTSGAAGYWAANSSMLLNDISNPVLSSAAVSPIAAGAGHVAGGTTAGLLQGQTFGEAFANSFDGIGKSMIVSGAIGVATTVGVSYAQGINPWTGKDLQITAKDLGIQSTLDRIEKGETFPHRNDGSVFQNRKNILPSTNGETYREYVHPTPRVSGPGLQRIVISSDGHIYYTPDHYKTFLKIR
jgi:guanyl-specific ribonuclease Sa